MGDKYQCKDCEEYFKAFHCGSCDHKLITNRCRWCHFDYMNDMVRGRREEDKEESEGLHVRLS